MKSLKDTITIITALLLMVSCGGDDIVESNGGITGEWTAIAFSADITSEVGSGTNMTASQTNVVGSNFDYDLTFEESDWTTSGGYDTQVTTQVSGTSIAPVTGSEQDITGIGTYTKEDDIITLQGSMFEYDMSSMGMTSINSEDQTVTYNITSDGQLTLSQDESTTTSMNGISVITTVKSVSVWIRK